MAWSARVCGGGVVFVVGMLASCAGVQEREPGPEMQVLAGPGRPSFLLADHLEANPEEFVVVDIGLWVRDLADGALGDFWDTLERERNEHLRALLERMGAAIPPPRSAGDTTAGIAHVARALLRDGVERADALVPAWRSEFTAVLGGASARRAWLPGSEAVDWRVALPNGAYASAAWSRRLFRATTYLRHSIASLDEQQGGAWRRAVEAALTDDVARKGNRAAFARIDKGLRELLGTGTPPMPGMLGDLPMGAAPDRSILSRATAVAWWDRLAAVHAQGPSAGADLRTAALRVAHELATESADDAWLAAYGRERWQHKWLDLADYTYVAVREVDCLASPLVRGGEPGRPRHLLVEPLPKSFAALRAAFEIAEAVDRTLDPTSTGLGWVTEIDDCLTLLAHQQAGTEPPTECLDRVWQRLLTGFKGHRDRNPETRLEGIEGPLRRTGCHLVRIPIRWQGKDASAVAFHWCVEHQDADGVWRRAVRDRK